MNFHEQHQEAVAVAKASAEGLLTQLAAVKARLTDEVLPAITAATGETPSVESARMALEWAQALTDRLDENIRHTDGIAQQLAQYGAGF